MFLYPSTRLHLVFVDGQIAAAFGVRFSLMVLLLRLGSLLRITAEKKETGENREGGNSRDGSGRPTVVRMNSLKGRVFKGVKVYASINLSYLSLRVVACRYQLFGQQDVPTFIFSVDHHFYP